jgi:hypothetical protein
MATVRYVGRHDGVEVELPLGGFAVVMRGDTLSTSTDQAEALLMAGIEWELVEEKEEKKSAGSGTAKLTEKDS